MAPASRAKQIRSGLLSLTLTMDFAFFAFRSQDSRIQLLDFDRGVLGVE